MRFVETRPIPSKLDSTSAMRPEQVLPIITSTRNASFICQAAIYTYRNNKSGCPHELMSFLHTRCYRANAHTVCSRTISFACPARDCSAASTSSVHSAFPNATAIFRNHRSYPIRRIGLPCSRSLKSASVHAKSSTSVAESSPFLGSKSGTVALRANLFHGQMSWQSSQP